MDTQFKVTDEYLVDVWALGVAFYCFTFLQLPFFDENQYSLRSKVVKKQLSFPKTRKVSHELKILLKKMIEKMPEKRATLQ